MKQKLIIILALLLILFAVIFMVKDFFFDSEKSQKNPYAYDMEEFKEVEDDQLGYEEIEVYHTELENSKGIAVDEKDRIYISGGNKINILAKNGVVKFSISTDNEIGALTIGDNGRIFVSAKDHIEIWSEKGELLESWDPINDCLITSLAVKDTLVYIADAGNKIVYQYNLDGKLLKKIGRKNKEEGIRGFFIPSPYFDLLIGREDQLWVVNPGYHAFEAYNDQGEQISSWSRTSMQVDGFSGCCNPSHIAMLSNGSFVTSEKGLIRVKVHNPSGDFQSVVAKPEQFDEETRGLDLAVDSKDRILVLDPKRKQVRIFEKKNREI